MSRKYLLAILSIVTSSSLVLTACGSDETLQCGVGTIEMGGRCLVVVDETPDPIECGPGTELNADETQCIATEVDDKTTCGTGTKLDTSGKNCIPIPGPPSVQCGDGTVLENGTCVANVTCTDNQTAVAGFCLSPAEALAESAKAQNIDESFVLELPIESEHFIFTGTIDEPADVDDKLVQDADFFTFDGEAGQWFEIALQSLGLPAPAFKIEAINEDPDNDDFVYERYSPFGSAAVARHIMLPVDGTYKVTILPEQSITHAGPFGASSWKYVGTVKQIEIPGALDIELINNSETPQELAGTFTVLPLNLYELETAEDAHSIKLTMQQVDDNVRGSVLVFSDLTTLIHTFDDVQSGQTIEIPATNDPVFVLVDWIQTDGPAQNYAIHAQSQGHRIPLELDAGASLDLDGFTAPANTIIKLSLQGASTEPLALSVSDDSGALIGKVRDIQTKGVTRLVANYAFYASGGEFSVKAENEGGDDHQAELIIEFIKPTMFDALAPNERTEISPVLPAKKTSFFLFESIEQYEILSVTQTNDQDTFSNIVNVTIHGADGVITSDELSIISTQDADWMPHEILHYSETGGPVLVQVRNLENVDYYDFTIHLDSSTPELISSADPGGVKGGESIEYIHSEDMDAGTVHWLRMVVAEPIEMTALLTALPPGDVDLYSYDTKFAAFMFSEYAGNESFDVFIAPGVYLFKMVAWLDTPGGYAFSALIEPSYFMLEGEGAAQSSFADAQEITEIPARVNGTANESADGRHEYWKYTATEDTTLSLDMTYLGGSFAMHVVVYNEDQSTVRIRTTEPIGRSQSVENMRSNLQLHVTSGETYFLRIGGENTQTNPCDFRYTIKITDLNP